MQFFRRILKNATGVVFLTTVMLFTTQSFAAVVKNVGEPVSTVDSAALNVPIYGQIELTVPDGSVQNQALYLTGAGKLQKTFGDLKIDVYAAASYIDTPQGISPTDTIASIAEAGAKVMQLTALMDLTAEDVKSAIYEALKANSVDLNDPAVKSALDKFQSGIANGETVTLVGYHNADGTETLLLDTYHGVATAAGPELATTFWKAWFGIVTDPDMVALKQALIGK